MKTTIILLVLLIGGILVLACVRLAKDDHKRRSRPRPRSGPRIIAPSPTDPWGIERLRRGERDFS